MEIPNIPETATETYLEHLEANIARQLTKTKNNKIKGHLRGMLREVRKRLEEFRQQAREESEQTVENLGVLELTEEVTDRQIAETLEKNYARSEIEQLQEFPQEPDQASSEDLEVLELTDIVEEEDKEISAEAQELLEEIQEQAQQELEEEAPDNLGVLLLTDLVEEEGEKTPAELEDLSEQEREAVKGRLKEVLKKFQERKQISPQESAGVLFTDIIQELSKEALFDKTVLSEHQQERVKDRLKGILETFQAEIQAGGPLEPRGRFRRPLTKVNKGVVPDEAGLLEETQETVQFRPGEFSERIQRNEKDFQPISTDEELIAACEKVSQGNSLAVFDSIVLTDRERDLINAFIAHLSTYKGLKKQQAFEMQHLTARSIHELDLIFKTYHIQGYLKGELKNVYNRLLNLRGRFSILLN